VIFNDTAVWTASPTPSTRLAGWRGVAEPNRYRFDTDTSRRLPSRPGEGRHEIRLRETGDHVYDWLWSVDFGIGATSPAAVGNLPPVWLAAGERADTAALRAEIHSSFGRSAQVWGQLFSLKGLQTSRDAGGAWSQKRVVTLHTDRAARTYPAFAKWLEDYVSPLRLRIRLRDSTRTWFDMTVANDSLVIRTRTIDGRLLPLEGGDRLLPDTVTLEMDMSAKLLFFRVGFRKLRTEFVTIRTAQQRGWSFRFNEEPDWQFPPLTQRMIRSSLRRPFSGEGTVFSIYAASHTGAPQTILSRRLNIQVQESAILRFLGRLANSGIDSYADSAQPQANAWISAAFGALRDDVRAILATEETRTPSR